MAQPVEFFFDFYSPYGYLASLQIDKIAARRHRTVTWRPIMLGVIFKQEGMTPLTDIPLVGPYSLHDFKRSARLINADFSFPRDFPKAALAPSRAYYWLVERDVTTAHMLAQKVYHAIFAEGLDGSDAQVVARLAEPLGVKRDELLKAIQQPKVKERLKQETELAIQRGVCGSPFFFVDDEPFWGNDRLWQVEKWLETGGW